MAGKQLGTIPAITSISDVLGVTHDKNITS
jgi:hypothetical protein